MESHEAVDIGIIVADTGCRQTEIVHISPEDIRLNHTIPHLIIRFVEEGEYARDIKNQSSIRKVPLLGASLQAMRRNPEGFARYRGKGNFSGTLNTFLRENDLFGRSDILSSEEDGASHDPKRTGKSL